MGLAFSRMVFVSPDTFRKGVLPKQVLPTSAVVACMIASSLMAQESGESGRFTFEGHLQRSSSQLGTVTRLDASAGYLLTKRWSLSFGVPYYFASPNGVGNVFSELRFTLPNPALNYASTITGTAPTGDRNLGLSTGHATVDWSNYFERNFGRLTPFGEVGFANAVSDTPLFVRPYTSYGFVTHAQGGARYRQQSGFFGQGNRRAASRPG